MHNKGRITRHHLIPKERKKLKTVTQNQASLHIDSVLKLWRDKHTHWHALFGNMTLDEAIEVLQRIKRIKIRTANTVPMKKRKLSRKAA